MECKAFFFFRIVLLIGSANPLSEAFYEERCAIPEKPKNANTICENCYKTENGTEICSFCSATCNEYCVLEGTKNEKRITLGCKNGKWVRLEKGTVGNDGKMPDCVYVGKRICRLPIQRIFPCQIFCGRRRQACITCKQNRCFQNCVKKLEKIEIKRREREGERLSGKWVSDNRIAGERNPGDRNCGNKKALTGNLCNRRLKRFNNFIYKCFCVK